jgi:peptide/nickel transport system permease protein
MRYLISRFFQGIVTLLGVSAVTFFLPNLYSSPSGMAVQILGQRATKKSIAAWLHQYGLDQPLVVQYWHWIQHAVTGDFGISYFMSAQYGQDIFVSHVIGSNVWRSIWLTMIPTVFSILVAIPIGLTQAVRRNRLYDHAMTTLVYVVYSTPAVLVCLLLVYYGAIKLNFGTVSIDSHASEVGPLQFPWWAIQHGKEFILPFLGIVVLSIGGLTRFMRGSALDTLVQDHVRTARAKGASPSRVLFRHVLRPSFIPMLTILGLAIPGIIGGALIVENVFNFPGMGVQAVQSTLVGDYTIVMALTTLTAGLVVIGNYFADILTAIVDPRVRLGGGRK